MTRLPASVLTLSALFAALTGCGASSSSSTATEPSPSVSASPTPTPTPTPSLAAVSDQTMCGLLFPSEPGQTSPLEATARAVSKSNLSQHDLRAASKAIGTLRSLERQAGPELRGQMQTYIAGLVPFVRDLQSSGSATIKDTTAIKAAGEDLINRCLPLL